MNPLWKAGDKWLNVTQVALLICISRAAVNALLTRPFDPLPPPFQFGNTRRWLASDIWAWMERQMARGPDAADAMQAPDETSVEGSAAIAKAPPQGGVDSPYARQDWLMELRNAYEAGMTLDELCQREKKGKAGLSALLREAGAEMRRPGRRVSVPPRKGDPATLSWTAQQ